MRSTVPTLVSLFLCASCALPSFAVQPRYGQLDISGSAGFSSGGVGAAADIEQAGLSEDSFVGGRADMKFGAPHLVALFQGPSFTGSGTLDVTVTDGTNTITAGTAVNSEVSLDQYDAALLFDLVPGDTIEAGIGFGVAYLDAAVRFEDTGTATVVATQQAFPLPLLAAVASVWIGPVQLGGYAGGMSFSYQDDSVRYLDADLYARWKILGGRELLRGSLVLGYRLTDLVLEYEDGATAIDTDLSLAGPYFGLEISL